MRSWIVAGAVVFVACGPGLPGDPGDATSEGGDVSSGAAPVSGGAASTGDGGASGAGGGAPTTGVAGSEGGTTMVDPDETTGSGVMDVDCVDAIDPFDANPYLLCRGGLASFTANVSAEGELGFSAYAQFFAVSAESQVVWDEVVHDPFEGIGDCAARTLGTSGEGKSEEVLWQDAGDLTFTGPDFAALAIEAGTPMSVIGYDAALGAPAWGQPLGLFTTGDTVPALDLPEVVRLPDPIELLTPALDAEVVGDDFVVEWIPSPQSLPTWISLNFELDAEHTLTIVCQMPDEGSFQVPPALLSLAALPRPATVWMRRAHVRNLAIDGEHSLRVSAETTLSSRVVVVP